MGGVVGAGGEEMPMSAGLKREMVRIRVAVSVLPALVGWGGFLGLFRLSPKTAVRIALEVGQAWVDTVLPEKEED